MIGPNGRIEDLRDAAKILKGRKLADGARGIVTPTTPLIYNMALDEGIIKIVMDAGFCVLNPTCGTRLGMSSGVLAKDEVCASTTSRLFNRRMGKGGMVHFMSPFSAAAAAVTGLKIKAFGGPAIRCQLIWTEMISTLTR